jgi:hypothetical protein
MTQIRYKRNMYHSKKLVVPVDGKIAEVPSMLDIARGLACQIRWGGQTVEPWTVLDHIRVCMIFTEPIISFFIAIHDAGEALCSDIMSPFKTEDQEDFEYSLRLQIIESLSPSLAKVLEDEKISEYIWDQVALVDDLVGKAEAVYFNLADVVGEPDIRFQMIQETIGSVLAAKDNKDTKENYESFAQEVHILIPSTEMLWAGLAGIDYEQ